MLIISLLKRHLLGSKGWDHRRTCFVLIYSPDLTLYPAYLPVREAGEMITSWCRHDRIIILMITSPSPESRMTPGGPALTAWPQFDIFSVSTISYKHLSGLHPRVASWLWHWVWGWRSDGGCPLPSPHAGLTFDQNWKYYCQKPGIPISQSCHI